MKKSVDQSALITAAHGHELEFQKASSKAKTDFVNDQIKTLEKLCLSKVRGNEGIHFSEQRKQMATKFTYIQIPVFLAQVALL